MYSQRTGEKRGSAKADLMIVVLFLVIMVLAGSLMRFCKSLPRPYDALSEIAACAAVAATIYAVYRNRISDYRYSFITDKTDEEAVAFCGENISCVNGKLFFERMVADKGKPLLAVEPGDMIALLAPGERCGEKPARTERFTIKGRKASYTLIYRAGDETAAVLFSPDDTLAAYIADALNESRSRDICCKMPEDGV